MGIFLRLVGFLAILIFSTLNSAWATPSGQTCTLDISPPQTHASASIAADTPSATVCLSGWICRSQRWNVSSLQKAKEDIEDAIYRMGHYGLMEKKSDLINYEYHSINLLDAELTEYVRELDEMHRISLGIREKFKNQPGYVTIWKINATMGNSASETKLCNTPSELISFRQLNEWGH